jgi:integrase
MTGHIKKRKRADGTASYQARIPSPANGRKDIVRTFERKRDAERWLAAQATAISTGEFIDPRTAATPFRELVATWERTRAAKLAPKTRERYDSITRTYLLPAFGSTPLGKLTRADFKEFFAGLAEQRKQDGSPRYSPGTLRKVQVVLSSILSEGVELGLLRENTAARLRLAASPRRDMTILTAAEVRALADAIPRPADRLAIYVAAYTGLRAGELWALRRRDVDVEGRRLVVARALKDSHGHLEFGDTKTDGSRRVVSLPALLANMIGAHLAGVPAGADALLFTSPGGGPGRPAGEGGPVRHGLFVRRVFRPAASASLPEAKANVRWHDLSHCCAALLVAAGRHPLEIKTRLGHSSITTTMDRYGWLFPSSEAALADALDATYEADNVNVIPLDAYACGPSPSA